MLFNSLSFLVFFPLVTLAYFFCTHRIKSARTANTVAQLVLLGASLFFYACWNAAYLALILISVTVTWSSGLCMERFGAHKKTVLALSLVINLGILFFFKYYNFFADTVNTAAAMLGADGRLNAWNVLLPVGISFYTFQALGYSIDVYRGTVRAERNFATYALFVTFFPQLVAGPIERSANLLPQFKTNNRFDYACVTDGLKLAAWGMFKKIVIADRLAVYVNEVYQNVGAVSGTALVLATVFFAFQILCDFSGYSDIAIGCAKVLGFNLMRNFRAPYFAHSIADFWRRWHISLSTWFKDYVFIPLGGSRVGLCRRCVNLMITFLVSGLWHGAALNFVAWGAVHGMYQVVGIVTKKPRDALCTWLGLQTKGGESGGKGTVGVVGTENAGTSNFTDSAVKKPYRVLQTLFTFALVCIAWVFFRANGLKDAVHILQKMCFCVREVAELVYSVWQNSAFGNLGAYAAKPGVAAVWSEGIARLLWLNRSGVGIGAICDNIALIVLLLCAERLTNTEKGAARLRSLPKAVKWIGYFVIFYATFATAFYNKAAMLSAQDFIYFQF